MTCPRTSLPLPSQGTKKSNVKPKLKINLFVLPAPQVSYIELLENELVIIKVGTISETVLDVLSRFPEVFAISETEVTFNCNINGYNQTSQVQGGGGGGEERGF